MRGIMRSLSLSPSVTAEKFLTNEWKALDGRLPDKIIDEFIKEITCPFMGEAFAQAFYEYDAYKAAQFIAKMVAALRFDAKDGAYLFLEINKLALLGKTNVDAHGQVQKIYAFEPE